MAESGSSNAGAEDFLGRTLSSNSFRRSTFKLRSPILNLTERPWVSIMLSLGLKLAVTPKSEVPGKNKKETLGPERKGGQWSDSRNKHTYLEVHSA